MDSRRWEEGGYFLQQSVTCTEDGGTERRTQKVRRTVREELQLPFYCFFWMFVNHHQSMRSYHCYLRSLFSYLSSSEDIVLQQLRIKSVIKVISCEEAPDRWNSVEGEKGRKMNRHWGTHLTTDPCSRARRGVEQPGAREHVCLTGHSRQVFGKVHGSKSRERSYLCCH